jgi:PAS domain S-box-containing protein
MKSATPPELEPSEEIAALRKRIVELEEDQTRHRQVEDEFRLSERKLRTFAKQCVAGVYIIQDGRFSYVNQRMGEIFGHDVCELVSAKSVRDLVFIEDWPKVEHTLQKRMRGESESIHYEFRGVRKDGTVINLEASGSGVDHEGSPAMIGTLLDVTTRVRAEEALVIEGQRFQMLSECAPYGIVMFNRYGALQYVNPKFKELVGYDLSRVRTGKELLRLIYPDRGYRREVVKAWLEDIAGIREGKTGTRTFNVTCQNGTEKIVLFQTVQVDNGDYLVICEDFTDLKRAEAALRESEARYRSLVDTMSEGFGIEDACGLITYANDRLCEMFGYSLDEVLGRPITSFLDPQDVDMLRQQEAKIRAGEHGPYEITWTGNNGRRIPTIVSATALFDENGVYIGNFAVLTNITERKQAEDALKESEERYRSLVDLSPDGIHVSLDGRFVFANKAMAAIVGAASPADLIGRNILDFVHPDHHNVVMDRVRQTAQAKVPVPLREEEYVRPDGTVVPVEVAAAPLVFAGRNAAQVVVRDMTARAPADHQIRTSLKEKEVLLREIHHRVKNNLQVVSSLLRLQSRYAATEEDVRVFKESDNRIQSMALIHEKLYQSKDLAQIDFKDYARSLVANLTSVFGVDCGRITMESNFEPVTMAIDTAIPCGLIANELISNSLKHGFPDGRKGTITISFSARDNELELVVSDEGIGLPHDVDPRNPRTMGLRLVDTLVQQLQGHMEVRVSGGTEFRIILPEGRDLHPET